MASTDLTKVSPSKRNIYTKLIDIAEKYTDIEDEDFLKTGLFGYMTESMAMIARDNALHKTMLYNESFLNTAKMSKSVYNWAKMFNIEITKATPAYATIQIYLPVDSVKSKINNPVSNPNDFIGLNSTSKGFILNKFWPISAGEYTFSLEHSIYIREAANSNGILASYIDDTVETTNYQKLSTKTLVVTKDPSGVNYIITARAYQYKIEEFEKQITSASFISTKIHSFEFDGQFAGANLFYEKGSSGRRKIDLRYTNLSDSEEEEEFAYYSLTSENTLQISFSSSQGNFVPEPNSTLYVQIFVTEGANAPIKFTGTAAMIPEDEDLRTLPISISFNPQDIIGGANAPSQDKIKETIVNEISTRDVIVTESDLNSYFAVLTSMIADISGGKLKFIKKRDDILKRVFTAYVLLRDGNVGTTTVANNNASYLSKCVPTNTVDVEFSINQNQALNFPRVGLLNENSVRPKYVHRVNSSENENDYVVPFYLYTVLNPFKKVKYLFTLTDSHSVLSYSNDGLVESVTGADSQGEGLYLIPNSARIVRGMSAGDSAEIAKIYTLTFSFLSNMDFGQELNAEQIRLTFYNEGAPVPSGSTAGGTFSSISSKQNSEGLYDVQITFTLITDDHEFDFKDDTADSDFGTFLHLQQFSGGLSENVSFGLEFTNYNLPAGSVFSAKFKTDSDLLLFRNLDQIMNSDVTINKTTRYAVKEKNSDGNYTGNILYKKFEDVKDDEMVDATKVDFVKSVTLSNVPVIKKSFFENSDDRTKFITQLFTYIDILKENLEKLETNTFFDLKFYNTSGISQYYTNAITTDIDLEMNIYLKFEYLNDTALQEEIRDYIRRAVDSSNENEHLKISEIIAVVSSAGVYGPYIDYIEFTGLNGTFSQNAEKNKNLSERAYPPEWLNIPKENLSHINFPGSSTSNN